MLSYEEENSMLANSNTLKTKYAFPAPKEPEFLTRRIDWYYQDRVQNAWGGGHILRGKIPQHDSIQLLSNDYLALANHPKILESQANVLLKEGNGMLMSAVFLMNGSNPTRRFEQRLAHFLQAEDGVICQSGFCANTGLLQSIADETTPVYIDMFAHMSLWEGIRSAGARALPFHHNDPKHLERQVLKHGPGIIVVDSVYSTSGAVCPLPEVVGIGEAHGCVLLVDESHSLGTHGEHGEGLVASLGLADKVHFRTASLAKAFAGRGGFITCSARFTDYFKCEARPAIFSSTLLPHEIAGFEATLKIIEEEKWRREKLHENADYLRYHLGKLGYNLQNSASQIISLEAGPDSQTIVLRDALESRGIFGAAFATPAAPKNRSLIRFSVNCDLTTVELDRIIQVCDEIRDEVGLKDWPSTRRMRKPVNTVTQPEKSPAMA
jgi:CAI-1 autoinducer synthase